MNDCLRSEHQLIFPTLAPGTMAALEVSILDADIGDQVDLSGPPFLPAGVTVIAYASATNRVKLWARNGSDQSATIPPAKWGVSVLKERPHRDTCLGHYKAT